MEEICQGKGGIQATQIMWEKMSTTEIKIMQGNYYNNYKDLLKIFKTNTLILLSKAFRKLYKSDF